MAHTPDGMLVQEVLDRDNRDISLGYVPIDSETEAGLAVLLVSTIRRLDNQS